MDGPCVALGGPPIVAPIPLAKGEMWHASLVMILYSWFLPRRKFNRQPNRPKLEASKNVHVHGDPCRQVPKPSEISHQVHTHTSSMQRCRHEPLPPQHEDDREDGGWVCAVVMHLPERHHDWHAHFIGVPASMAEYGGGQRVHTSFRPFSLRPSSHGSSSSRLLISLQFRTSLVLHSFVRHRCSVVEIVFKFIFVCFYIIICSVCRSSFPLFL